MWKQSKLWDTVKQYSHTVKNEVTLLNNTQSDFQYTIIVAKKKKKKSENYIIYIYNSQIQLYTHISIYFRNIKLHRG